MYAYINSQIVPFDQAKVHVLSPVVRYAAAVFEAIPAFKSTSGQLNFWRIKDHLERLEYACKIMRFTTSVDYLEDKIEQVVKANNFDDDFIVRPMVYLDGVSPGGSIGELGEANLAITAFPKLPSPTLETGVTAQVSSWVRIPDTVMPARVKCVANYHNARLAEQQAKLDGYHSSILLNSHGFVSEGPGMCFIMVRDGKIIAPNISSDILESITRDSVLKLATQLNYGVEERQIARSELYLADEAFYCGTGWAVTPVISIDRHSVGTGQVGPVVKNLQDAYFNAVRKDPLTN